VTAGAGGFVDITARARKIVFSGYFTAGAGLAITNGALAIEKEGKVKKLVEKVEQVSFSGRRAKTQGQEITYITERCVMTLAREGVTISEIAPGVDLQRDILDQAAFPLRVAPTLKAMDAALFQPEPIGLRLKAAPTHGAAREAAE
jgi:acyl CoA:acetate/3-ketoacid CoA transferase